MGLLHVVVNVQIISVIPPICSLGWCDIAFFAIFKEGHIAADLV